MNAKPTTSGGTDAADSTGLIAPESLASAVASAVAVPPLPAVEDERARFRVWAAGRGLATGGFELDWNNPWAQCAWDAWQARAALSAPAGEALLSIDQQRALVAHVKAIRHATKRLHDSWIDSQVIDGKEFVVIAKDALMSARWEQTENALEQLFMRADPAGETRAPEVVREARAYLALAEMATPGPWHWDVSSGQAKLRLAHALLQDHGDEEPGAEEDRAFIAASRKAPDIIRALLDQAPGAQARAHEDELLKEIRYLTDTIAEGLRRYPNDPGVVFIATATAPLATITQADTDAAMQAHTEKPAP